MKIKYYILLFFTLLLLFTSNNNCSENLKAIIEKNVPFRTDGKISIPHSIQHVRIDIGLSYSAPMSQHWLSHHSEKNLLVFGFEPNPSCVESICSGAQKWHPSHGTPLNKEYIGSQFFVIPCALGIEHNQSAKFYVTQDCGCSSLYAPKIITLEKTITVPIFTLANFFDLFPFDTHPIIDYIKIDAQGADLDIVKGAAHYLSERVVYVTLEAEDFHYDNTTNSVSAIEEFMIQNGFIRYNSSNTEDPTYFNPRFLDYTKETQIQIYQKG